MSDGPQERMRNLRNATRAVIETLESVRERARGFVVKQVEVERASAEAQLKLDHLKTQLAERIREIEAVETRPAALRRDRDQLYLSWQAVNANLTVIAHFQALRDNWKPAKECPHSNLRDVIEGSK